MIVGLAWEYHHQKELQYLFGASKGAKIAIFVEGRRKEPIARNLKAIKLRRRTLHALIKIFRVSRDIFLLVFGSAPRLTLATPMIDESISAELIRERLVNRIIIYDDGLSTVFTVQDYAAQDYFGATISYFSKYEKWLDSKYAFARRTELSTNIELPVMAFGKLTCFFGSPILEYTSITEERFLHYLKTSMELTGSEKLLYLPHRRESWFYTEGLPSWIKIIPGGQSIETLRKMEGATPAKFSTFFSSSLVDLLVNSGFEMSNFSFFSLLASLEEPELTVLETSFKNVRRIENFFEHIGVRRHAIP